MIEYDDAHRYIGTNYQQQQNPSSALIAVSRIIFKRTTIILRSISPFSTDGARCRTHKPDANFLSSGIFTFAKTKPEKYILHILCALRMVPIYFDVNKAVKWCWCKTIRFFSNNNNEQQVHRLPFRNMTISEEASVVQTQTKSHEMMMAIITMMKMTGTNW